MESSLPVDIPLCVGVRFVMQMLVQLLDRIKDRAATHPLLESAAPMRGGQCSDNTKGDDASDDDWSECSTVIDESDEQQKLQSMLEGV